MARNSTRSNRTIETVTPADVGTLSMPAEVTAAFAIADQAQVAAQPIKEVTVNLYSGNIMRQKPETGYILLMVRNVNGAEIHEEAVALFLEDHTQEMLDLKTKVGDAIAFFAECYVDSDLGPLPRDNKPVRKAIGFVPGTLSMVRRKPVAIAPVAKTDAQTSPGMAKRLLELGTSLAEKLGFSK